MIRALDVHAAGWPLRVVFDGSRDAAGETLGEKAERLWKGAGSPVRWIQREPRGHAALRVGVIVASGTADAGLLVFDSDGPCPADEMDALCAAAALRETGTVAGDEPVVLETSERRIGLGAEDARGWRSAEGTVTLHGGIGTISWLSPGKTPQGDYHGAIRYEIDNAAAWGIPFRSEHAARLERLLLAGSTNGKKAYFLEETGDGTKGTTIALAMAGRDGKPLRAPEGGAAGAALAMLHGRDSALVASSVRIRALSGGWLEGTVLSAEAGETGFPTLRWELRARARLIASCEFVLDPADPFADGFLLR